MGNFRRVEITINGEFKEIKKEELKKGDVFRLISSETGIIVKDKAGHSIFRATDNPVPIDPPGNFSILTEPVYDNPEEEPR